MESSTVNLPQHSVGVHLHWIKLTEEPTIIYPWPRDKEPVILWNRLGFASTGIIYNNQWNIDSRPVDKRFLCLSYSHWARVPKPQEGEG